MSYEIKREPKILKCPFCDKGQIEASYTPARVETQIARGSGMNKTTRVWVDERYQVIKDCPNCGKTASQIEKSLSKGTEESKPPSRQEILKRLKDAGLPTKV
ncbi:hypothetical protein SU86_007235 [Candidatus Nitrosotenuis cloacae]|uniref:Uncharacterized protein n=1 Tax=Candidatus Nitrosotenuis cloacae TaxID=1603555 RepID=A0A3G1B3F7_9ARCH|nr:hypothetical protein SU86_007235 [Candidatus Nitrosotenuis cloacae]